MTTVCTGRPMPDGNGAVKMSDAIFNATIAQTDAKYGYLNLFNNSQYGKLAMGNTNWHIRTNIENVVNNISGINTGSNYKLVLFAGHDTTIMSLLAAIQGDAWEVEWPGYASLVTIELYQSVSSTPEKPAFLFRMVYNSKPLLVPPCTTPLCDLNILLDVLSYAKETMPECTASSSDSTITSTDDDNNDCNDSSALGEVGWTILVVVLSFASALIGGAFVFFYDRKYLGQSALQYQQTDSPIHKA